MIEFTGIQTGRKCPFPLRVIKSVDEKTGKEITILTNIFNLTAGYIAGMYRVGWNIEIFFKTIKRNLRIKKFFDRTENTVKTQIRIALTVYLLYMKLRQLCIYGGKNFTNFMSELKVRLFERKDLFEWFAGNLPPAVCHPNDFQQELWV